MALLLNGTDGVTFNDGSEQWAAASPIGTKNLIINGDMRIAQRGTSNSTGTNGYYTVDRFLMRRNNLGAFTYTQDTDVPSGQGFTNSLKWDCTTADASPAADDFASIQHRIEGQNLQHLKYGTSSAESVTVSFWIKSNLTGDLSFRLYQADDGRDIGTLITINTADTWEKKTVTFVGDTTGVIDNDNGLGLNLIWQLGAGSNRTSGTLNTSWGTYAQSGESPGQTINLASSTSNYINITGVQLEVGDTATPFEVMPYDMQLARCQRYYQPVNAISGNASSTSGLSTNISFVVPMRATPSISVESVLKIYDGVTTYTQSSANAGSYLGNEYGGLWYSIANFSGLTQYRPYGLNTNLNNNIIRASAEL